MPINSVDSDVQITDEMIRLRRDEHKIDQGTYRNRRGVLSREEHQCGETDHHDRAAYLEHRFDDRADSTGKE